MQSLKVRGCHTSIRRRINCFFCFVILMQKVKNVVEQENKIGMRAGRNKSIKF
jgi:hypothetical protein